MKPSVINLLRPFFLLILGIVMNVGHAQVSNDWYGQHGLSTPDRPYLYYPDEAKSKTAIKDQLPTTGEAAQQALEEFQQSVKLSRALAIMNPSEDTLREYIKKQEVMLEKSAMFTDVWRRTLWNNPELDYSQNHRPTNSLAIASYDQQKDQRTKEIIANIAQTQGLLFFIRGDCQYCHAFAPTLKQFQEAYGIQVMAVSLDGGVIPGFETNTVPDNGISQSLGVTVTPTLFLADTITKEYKSLGAGVMSMSELENRFVTVLNEPGSSF